MLHDRRVKTAETAEKSLCDLMEHAFRLSLRIVYSTIAPKGDYLNARDLNGQVSEKTQTMIYAWADGLIHKYYDNMASGHCSFQAMIDFDVGHFEESVKGDIQIMEEILAKIGAPKKLTQAEYRARGYRGEEAGYTAEEERVYWLEYYQKETAKLESEVAGIKNKLARKEIDFDQYYDVIYGSNSAIADYKKEIEKLSALL